MVKAGAPGLPIEKILPFISMFAVANTALINMLMASRLIYGMAKQHVLPPVLGVVHAPRRTPWVAILFTTTIAFGLIFYVTAFANDSAISVLGGTTSLLLLAVFAVVNVAVLVLRRDVQAGGEHFKTPTGLPVIGCIASLYLVTPLSGRPDARSTSLPHSLVILGVDPVLHHRSDQSRGSGSSPPASTTWRAWTRVPTSSFAASRTCSPTAELDAHCPAGSCTGRRMRRVARRRGGARRRPGSDSPCRVDRLRVDRIEDCVESFERVDAEFE